MEKEMQKETEEIGFLKFFNRHLTVNISFLPSVAPSFERLVEEVLPNHQIEDSYYHQE